MKAPKDPPHLIFRVIEYSLIPDNPTVFSLNDLRRELKLAPFEFEIIKKYLVESVEKANPNHIMYVFDKNDPASGGGLKADDWLCTLLPSAVMQYNEYEEIVQAGENAKEARKQANQANNYSKIAIGIAVFFGIVQTVLQVVFN